jgi:PAT family beta-lactamase induction signal transducer AmpG
VWHPFIGFLARHRALEILAFVLLYKLADNLAQGLHRPFLIDMHFDSFDRGVALTTIGLFATLAGTFAGGFVTTAFGLGHSLWIFGFLQIFSNIGYVFVARTGAADAVITLTDRAIMYGALGFESVCSGLGTGAYGVLLLRMTQKRFSVTQYALFSSLFAIPRLFAGPVIGFSIFALSHDDPAQLPRAWELFYWGTLLAGVPGLLLLQRFSPLGTREPAFAGELVVEKAPLTREGLALRALAGLGLGIAAGVACVFGLNVLEALRKAPLADLPAWNILLGILQPEGIAGWLQFLGILTFALVAALMAMAYSAARHGAARQLGQLEDGAD